ncbi:MAG: NAD-glutamate dehydrogenase, partial [Actinomycetia bacterium]|nr:NAD-glutamate dehydrogenase [Actinomycetes bacterium]
MSDTRTPDASTPAPNPDARANADVFLRRYLAHAEPQLPGRSSSWLTELAHEHLALGMVRPGSDTLLRIRDGEAESDTDTTSIDIVTPDAPYLVDSLRAELARHDHPVVHLLHPQLVVTRDDAGALTEVHDLEDSAELPTDARTEAWMHIELDQVPAAEQERLAADLERVIGEVQYSFADGPELRQMIRKLADQLGADPGEFDQETSSEAGNLLRWLADGNYMPLGHIAYAANELASLGQVAKPRDARGVLRGAATISPMELLPAFRSGTPLVIFKSPLVSSVRRSSRYDCVTVMTPGTTDSPPMLHVFLGLIISFEDATVERVPVLRGRIAELLRRAGFRAASHTGRQLVAALRTLPRDELLEAPSDDLLRLAQLVVARAEQGTVGVFVRKHLNQDFVSVLVYFASDRLGPETRRRVETTVLAHWPGELVGRQDRIVGLGLARMYFLIAMPAGETLPSPNRSKVEAEVAQAIRRWSDDLADLLTLAVGEEPGEALMRRYAGALPEAYKEDSTAATAVRDLLRLEQLPPEDGLAFDMYTPAVDDQADRRLKVFCTGQAQSLARVLPRFTQMGIEILDERPFEITVEEGKTSWIYDFGLRLPRGVELDEASTRNVIDALRLLWRGELEQDGFNALVTRAGLTWWQTNVLRAYAKYLRQAGTTFSQGYIEQALVDNPSIARKLAALFEARFDPSAAPDPATAGAEPASGDPAELIAAIEEDLTKVASLDQDRILRSILGLINATLRTNAYRLDPDGARRVTLAFKLDPHQIPELPAPRPKYEIWVYAPRVEGVHLRFGTIARGGLRWSDRREDFRTEILGLVKAQTVKNTVIVPTGAKGGFYCKQLPDPNVNRDAWLAEGIACYRTFIGCLLDLTDNYVMVDGRRTVAPPEQTRRYDGDDPYLVVAADKGTATFSDLANEIAVERGFWLGDAFASGGSVGFDHKEMGITAKGAWESVKYHFREMGVNTQTEDFTVVGIGDMSGDVFGNGMLLSRHIKLLAAFDHRHIFLDPAPNPGPSFAERKRMFELPRSSWADYDSSLISPGGGVYARTLKSVPISPEVRDALGIDPAVTAMTPQELIHAILLAPVDLLWNGGIGTYVKATSEPHSAAGDKANDAVRVNGDQLRAKVVGEGGNLGCTQLGRIEYSRAGGRICTDFIDNSAGVDTSDHEVNIKILLDRAVAAGTL